MRPQRWPKARPVNRPVSPTKAKFGTIGNTHGLVGFDLTGLAVGGRGPPSGPGSAGNGQHRRGFFGSPVTSATTPSDAAGADLGRDDLHKGEFFSDHPIRIWVVRTYRTRRCD
jgi:hypothetical protein